MEFQVHMTRMPPPRLTMHLLMAFSKLMLSSKPHRRCLLAGMLLLLLLLLRVLLLTAGVVLRQAPIVILSNRTAIAWLRHRSVFLKRSKRGTATMWHVHGRCKRQDKTKDHPTATEYLRLSTGSSCMGGHHTQNWHPENPRHRLLQRKTAQ
jgi:hypothetical protein